MRKVAVRMRCLTLFKAPCTAVFLITYDDRVGQFVAFAYSLHCEVMFTGKVYE
jgi:hypothetical protein